MTCDLANPIFTDEAKATAHIEADRWPDGAYCPHCRSLNVHKWDFKWNTRNITDGERAALALKGAEGRRLTYRQPNDAAHA
jgi:hypothetical protein